MIRSTRAITHNLIIMSEYGKKVIALLDSNSGFGANIQRMDDDIQDLKQREDELESLVNSIIDIDLPDVELSDFLTNTGNQILLNTNTEEWSLRGLNTTGDAQSKFLKIKNGELSIYHLKDPSNETHAANQRYVDTKFASIDLGPYSTTDYVDQLFNSIDLSPYLQKSGTQLLSSSKWKLQQPDAGGTNRNFIEIENSSMKLFHIADPTDGDDAWAANKKYVNDVAAEYLPLAGGNLTGDVELSGGFTIDHGTGDTASKKFYIIGETSEGTDQDLFWSYKNRDGTEDAVNYKGKMTNDFNLVNKAYVDNAVASVGGSVVPVVNSTPSDITVGSLWFNTTDNCLYIKKS